MIKFAFPVHHPKFPYAQQLLESYYKYFKDDIFVLMSNQIQLRDFSSCSLGKHVSLETEDYHNGATVKKILGCKYIFENTDAEYVAMIDSECSFFREFDLNKLIERYHEGIIYGNRCNNEFCHKIIESPFKFFEPQQKERIRHFIKFNSYFWFNDIQVYYKPHFLQCIEELKILEKFRDIQREDFDYIIYIYFLLEKGIKKYAELNFELPSSIGEQQRKFPEEYKQFYEITKPFWCLREEDFTTNSFMTFHKDRL